MKEVEVNPRSSLVGRGILTNYESFLQQCMADFVSGNILVLRRWQWQAGEVTQRSWGLIWKCGRTAKRRWMLAEFIPSEASKEAFHVMAMNNSGEFRGERSTWKDIPRGILACTCSECENHYASEEPPDVRRQATTDCLRTSDRDRHMRFLNVVLVQRVTRRSTRGPRD